MSVFFNRSVTIESRAVTGRDSYGNDVYGTTTSTLTGCDFQPRTTQERVDDARSQLQIDGTLYAPASAEGLLTAADAVLIDGARYEVNGAPSVWQGLAVDGYLEVPLRRVTG